MKLTCFYKEKEMSDTVRAGQSISVHYTGKLNDGTVFDTSEGNDPFTFTVGTAAVIPGFDQAVAGMQVGEKKEISIPVDQAYGDRNLEAVMVIEPSAFPEEMEISVGMQVQGEGPNGSFPAVVTAIASNGITIDANHPLSGNDLNFEIELISINEE